MQKKKEAFDYEALKKKTWNNFARAKIYSAKEVPLLRRIRNKTTAKTATILNY
jgi:hypothetical protein